MCVRFYHARHYELSVKINLDKVCRNFLKSFEAAISNCIPSIKIVPSSIKHASFFEKFCITKGCFLSALGACWLLEVIFQRFLSVP